jgi:glycosyltransferase involved in cell wall biosynthesis
MLRVCYITMQFPTVYETFAANDVRTLRRQGVEVSVHSLRPAHPSAARLQVEYGLGDTTVTHNTLAGSLAGLRSALGQPVTFLSLLAWIFARNWRRPDYLVRSLILLPRVFQIVELIARERPDVVHLFWGHYPALVGHLARQRCPGLVLSVFLGAYDLTWSYGGTPPVARAAQVVWTHARENVASIKELGVAEERIVVSYRGVDLAAFATVPPRKTTRRIISASRLIPAKAVDDVLRSFARVRAAWPDASLVLLGDGPERPRLEALAAELGLGGAVTFRGHVAHEVVRAELAAAEVFLLMSQNESERLPNVVKEAMYSRCICVVAESPGLGELLRDGVHGYVVAPGDVETAAARICQVFAGELPDQELAAAAQLQIASHFDVERNIARYVEHWRRDI